MAAHEFFPFVKENKCRGGGQMGEEIQQTQQELLLQRRNSERQPKLSAPILQTISGGGVRNKNWFFLTNDESSLKMENGG